MMTPTSARTTHVWSEKSGCRPVNHRASERRTIQLPGRLTWKDHRGMTRFLSVVTRDVSEFGVFVECESAVTIPLYRLVQFQLEQNGEDPITLPASLRQGRLLSAVYRVSPPASSGGRQGFALRLMVDPRRVAVAMPSRATA